MKRKNFIIIGIVVTIIVASFVYFTLKNYDSEIKTEYVELETSSLFRVMLTVEDYEIWQNGGPIEKAVLFPKSENSEIYKEIGVSNIEEKIIVVIPIFTAKAYEEPGFYTYYRGECDKSCLKLELKDRNQYTFDFRSSGQAIQVMNLLGYKFITDLEIHNNPSTLSEFDKVIILHNEYVTRAEFDAIISHPNVIFLYPNALYAEIEYDENENTIKLLRGHNYPTSDIQNGFDWEFDNTHPYEYDTQCQTLEFYEIVNGHMLNCYPDRLIHNNYELLKMLKGL